MKTFWNWILGVEKSVEDHLAPLTRIIRDLEQHAVDMEIKAAQHMSEVLNLNDKIAVARAESDSANAAAQKISALIS